MVPGAAVAFLAMALSSPAPAADARGVPAAMAEKYQLSDPWYAQYSEVRGIPVVGSAMVDDRTLQLARRTVARVLATVPRDTVRQLRQANFRIAIIARGETISAVPGARDRLGSDADSRYWGGFGATRHWPLCVATEANLADRAGDENILVYSLAASIAELALRPRKDSFAPALDKAYAHAATNRRWANTYAATSANSYWAEGVQPYFNANREGSRGGDGIHGHINTRRELRAYDPLLYRLIADEFGAGR
ncbi:hypothetical protein [Sphingopyxis sp.]|uniref:hypothetical protein n=1 Tax=Sphingopyxis sp. TaxID=1908224 RepID=UPI003F6F7710